MLQLVRSSAALSFSRLLSVVASSSGADASSSARFTGEIPYEAVQKRFLLSSGPGGQNVQKNSTKVQIRVRLDESVSWLPGHLRSAVRERLSSRMSAEGEVVIESDRTRERQMNLADCLDKLRATIFAVQRKMESRQETEEDVRLTRERAARAARIRLAEKRNDSQKKRDRQLHITSI